MVAAVKGSVVSDQSVAFWMFMVLKWGEANFTDIICELQGLSYSGTVGYITM